MSAVISPNDEQRYRQKVMEAVIRIAIVVLLALWGVQIFQPFLGPVVWGIIIAIAMHRSFSRNPAGYPARRGQRAGTAVPGGG